MMLQYLPVGRSGHDAVWEKGCRMMKSVHLRRPSILLGALAVSLVALAIEASAQSGSTPEWQLSDAITEVLSSPFYEDATPLAARGHGLLPPAVGYRNAAHGRVDLAPSLSAGLRNAGAPLAQIESSPRLRDGRHGPQTSSPDHAPSRGKMFLLTTVASAVGFGGTVLWAEQCTDVVPVDIGHVPAGTGKLSLCPGEGVVFIAGYLATITMTGGAATLAGGGFRRSLMGSVLGFGGAVLTAVGIAVLKPDLPGELLFGFPIVHAAITTLVAG